MGKEVLLDVIKGRRKDYVPWVPFAGIHAGFINGYDAETVLKDENALVTSLTKVYELYRPDGMPVVFDLQLEAEILGCDLLWAKDTPPSVSSHPLKDVDEVPCKCKMPDKSEGRLPIVLNAMAKMRKIAPDTALFGLICGPLTLASHLRGNDFLLDIIMDEDYANGLLDYCTEVAFKMTEMYIEAGMDVISVVDPLLSQVSPATIDDLLTPYYQSIFEKIKAMGKGASLFVCGNATQQMTSLCQMKPDFIAIDENVNMAEAQKITDAHGLVISGNIPLTTTMLHGNQMDNMAYVVDLMDSLSPGYIVSPGCDMPFNTPIENAIAAGQAVKDIDAAREMVKNYTKVEEDIEVSLPDYQNLTKPFVEVFTLDSASCAACTYMWKAAERAQAHFGEQIDTIEYKYTLKENIARCKKMNVAHLPSIYINGELKWSSIIPTDEALFSAIEAYL